jgi:hypothetical protein
MMIHARTVGLIAHQPANFDSLARRIGRGNAIGRCERGQLDPPARQEHVASDVQSFGAVAHERDEGRFDLAPGAGLEDLNLQSQCTRGV